MSHPGTRIGAKPTDALRRPQQARGGYTMDAGYGEAVLGALAGGGIALARHEAARLINSCLTWLRSKGRAGTELAEAARAFTQGADPDIAVQLEQLGPLGRARAGAQLDQVLADPDHPADLDTQAQHIQDMLTQAGLLTHTPTGTLIYQPQGPLVIGNHNKIVKSIKVKKGNVRF